MCQRCNAQSALVAANLVLPGVAARRPRTTQCSLLCARLGRDLQPATIAEALEASVAGICEPVPSLHLPSPQPPFTELRAQPRRRSLPLRAGARPLRPCAQRLAPR